jgi:bifunctional non-homologous end joining protein LigD
VAKVAGVRIAHPERVSWSQVIEAARLIKLTLQQVGLKSFVKTTGGVGLHAVVPLAPGRNWTQCFKFSRALAETIVRSNPMLYTISLPKLGRDRKILIDYLRYNPTDTSVAAYSTRARPNAPVSVPLDWDELSSELKSDRYTVQNLSERLRRLKTDPWNNYWSCRQQLEPQMIGRVQSL